MGKAKRKPRPQPPRWYWADCDNCWDCNHPNNCNQCKRLKQQRAHEREKREGNGKGDSFSQMQI